MQKHFKGLRPLHLYIPKMTRSVYKRRGFQACDIVHDWPHIVGQQWAEMTSPEKLVFRPGARTAGILYLQVYGAAALMIQHIQSEIIARANTYFGYQAVGAIKLRQSGLRPTPIAPSPPVWETVEVPELENWREGPLKEALKGLGQGMKYQQPEPHSDTENSMQNA